MSSVVSEWGGTGDMFICRKRDYVLQVMMHVQYTTPCRITHIVHTCLHVKGKLAPNCEAAKKGLSFGSKRVKIRIRLVWKNPPTLIKSG